MKAPLSAVTVWVTVSWFVQITFVPIFTVRAAGLKAKFAIETLLPVLAGGVVGVGVGGVVGAVVGVGVGGVVGAVVGVAVGAVVGVAVGAVVGVAVGAVVGVLADVVVVVAPQAARSTSRHRASRHSQAPRVVGAEVFCITLPLLQDTG